MQNTQNVCPHCGAVMASGNSVCSVCGKAQSEAGGALYLQSGVVLPGGYEILAVDSVQIDSVSYLARRQTTGETVLLREFLPRALVQRADGVDVTIRRGSETAYQTCLDDFVRLWRTIRSLHEQAPLPQVQDVFFSGGTVYVVSSDLDCITLEEYLDRPEKLLRWASAVRIFLPVIRALGRLHACGVLHGAISPKTLFVATDGKLHLGGFSVSQTKGQLTQLHSVPTPGFAPIELYDSHIGQGAYTDVYALAAVMYYAVTGDVPPPAPERAANDVFSQRLPADARLTPLGAQTLSSALQVYPQRRTRTMEQFILRLENKPQPQPRPQQPAAAAQPEPEEEAAPSTTPGMLALKVFFSSALVIVLLFCTLYATVLYDKLDIPLLDRAFSSFSFLPMNEAPTTTTRPPTTAPKTDAAATVLVPNFMSLTYSNIVRNTTFNRNFTLEFDFEESDTVKKNSIISQSVEAGKEVPLGTKITIVVSSGKPMVVLDDVLGMDYVDAYEILTDKGFTVEKTMVKNDGTHTVGEVCEMSLVAGLSFEKGTRVTLSVWDAGT